MWNPRGSGHVGKAVLQRERILFRLDFGGSKIWVNYHISPTWILRPYWDDFPQSNHDSSEGEQWGRYNLPRKIALYSEIRHSSSPSRGSLPAGRLCWSLAASSWQRLQKWQNVGCFFGDVFVVPPKGAHKKSREIWGIMHVQTFGIETLTKSPSEAANSAEANTCRPPSWMIQIRVVWHVEVQNLASTENHQSHTGEPVLSHHNLAHVRCTMYYWCTFKALFKP